MVCFTMRLFAFEILVFEFFLGIQKALQGR
jgi:hypothetical protein